MGRALACILLAANTCAFGLNPDLDVSQYAHTAWKFREGFTKGEIHDIAQTSDGYLWLGTGFGLFRFDGVRNVAWQPPHGQNLPSAYTMRLLAARDGTLWIGTLTGLASWRNGRLTQYAELAGLPIIGLVEDQEGSVWAGSNERPHGKLCAIRNGGVRCYEDLGGLGARVSALHEDVKGNLWVGMLTGVWRWKPGPPEFYPVPGELDGIRGLVDSQDGALLMAATGGVKRIVDRKVRMAYPFPPAQRKFQSNRSLRDRDGGLWVGTTGGGIVHIHHGRTDTFSQVDGLSGDSVGPIFEDREGTIWVSTVNGLDRFRELPVVTYSGNQGLSNTPAGAVLAAGDGSILATTLDGLNRLISGQFTVYREHGTLSKMGVREIARSGVPEHGLASLYQDSRGRIWVSTATKIGYLDGDRFISSPVPGGNIQSVNEDTEGNLWMAHLDLGLFRLSPSNDVKQIPWATLGQMGPARSMAADPSLGGVWLGFFRGGVVYFRDGQIRASYSTADGIGEGRVNDLRFDRGGALWASTEGGLSRLKDGRVVTLSSKNGLPCDAVHWAMEDDANSVWLNTPCGLVRVAQSDLDAWVRGTDRAGHIQTTVFDSIDGLGSLAIAGGFGPRVTKSPDGKLWFVMPDGIGRVDPVRLPFNKLPPPVHIEQITADRKTYDAGAKLPPLVRDLEIDYTALSLAAPEKNRFKYKLEGYDRDWQDVGNRRQAFYGNLPPRNYRFRVMASNNSGVWNETGDSLDFSIAPAYYQTTWFLVSCAAAFLALLWALYRYRLHQIAREFNANLEGRVDERLRLARDLHDTLLQSFHGLMFRFQAARNMLPRRPEEAMQALDGALERTEQAMAEGRDAIHSLRASTVTTNELAQAVTALGAELASHDSAKFHVVVEGPPRDLHPILRDEVYAIAREAARNAFRHAQAHDIEVQITYNGNSFQLRIRDDGKGIDPGIVAEGRTGHYGVPGMRERAKRIGGKLDVWTGTGAGTEIELSIPGSIAYGTSPGRRGLGLFRKARGREEAANS